MKKISAVMAAMALMCFCNASVAETIVDAKKKANDLSVTLSGKVVTYASTDSFYIEEDSRSCGIRVDWNNHGLTAGMRADVQGSMQTDDTNKERYILPTSAPVQTAAPNATGTIAAIGIRNSAIGGADWLVVDTGG